MKTIWKYQFEISDGFNLLMPYDSDILSVQVQENQPCMWVLVDTNQPVITRRFRIFGTGFTNLDELGKFWNFISTFQMPPFVWHLFEYFTED